MHFLIIFCNFNGVAWSHQKSMMFEIWQTCSPHEGLSWIASNSHFLTLISILQTPEICKNGIFEGSYISNQKVFRSDFSFILLNFTRLTILNDKKPLNPKSDFWKWRYIFEKAIFRIFCNNFGINRNFESVFRSNRFRILWIQI